jgi:hypothetical protein
MRRPPVKGVLLLLIILSALLAQGVAASPPASVLQPLQRSTSTPNLQFYGTTDDFRNDHDQPSADQQMGQIKKMGANLVRIVVTSSPRQGSANTDFEAACYAYRAAAKDGITVLLGIIPNWKLKHPPLRAGEQSGYATLAANYEGKLYDKTNPDGQGACTQQPVFYVSVGNEPNNQLFWPSPDPAAYESLVAKTYDAVKSKGREIGVNSYVLAGETSSLGDMPTEKFIAGMVSAYRDSGRKNRIMDGWAHHPYGTNSADPPSTVHPGATIGVADYPRLVAALGGFDGTGQTGSSLDIWYTEFGADSIIPPDKSHMYTGTKPASSGAVPESTQGDYYDSFLTLANSQATVRAASIFLPRDEKNLARRQTSLFYRDGTPKTSLQTVLTVLPQVCRSCVLP